MKTRLWVVVILILNQKVESLTVKLNFDFIILNHRSRCNTLEIHVLPDLIIQIVSQVTKINLKNVENYKQHFKAINQELEEKGRKLIDKINALS